jgi:hypothetical protein
MKYYHFMNAEGIFRVVRNAMECLFLKNQNIHIRNPYPLLTSLPVMFRR